MCADGSSCVCFPACRREFVQKHKGHSDGPPPLSSHLFSLFRLRCNTIHCLTHGWRLAKVTHFCVSNPPCTHTNILPPSYNCTTPTPRVQHMNYTFFTERIRGASKEKVKHKKNQISFDFFIISKYKNLRGKFHMGLSIWNDMVTWIHHCFHILIDMPYTDRRSCARPTSTSWWANRREPVHFSPIKAFDGNCHYISRPVGYMPVFLHYSSFRFRFTL